MPNPKLTKTYKAGAAIKARRFIKFGASDGTVIQAAALDDKVIGVSERFDVKLNADVDVIHDGIADVEAGAAVVRGDLVGPDADGKAIIAAAATARVGGVALKTAAAGDYFPILVTMSQVK